MAQQVYPPNVIVRTIINDFFRYRNFVPVGRGGGTDTEIPVFDDDRVISDMEQFYYVRIDALRETPRGSRDWVVILILSVNGKYAHHSPDLRKMLEGVLSERSAKEGRLDELIVVAEEEFFKKKNLTDVLREIRRNQVGGPDAEGKTPFFSAYPYYNFALVVPEHKSVPIHRVMDPEEVAEFLQRERMTRNDIPIIFSNDAPIVWNGGREGQVVEITRDSQTAGIAMYYRRIERGGL